MAESSAPVSNWTPLTQPLFRMLWIAVLVSNVGVWTQDMASVWLITSATESALLIALMAVAANLPFLLFSFPAGVLAESLNHKTMLFFTALFIAVMSFIMALVSLWGASTISPVVVLIYVFAFGIGTAFFDPVWKGVVPQLVDSQLHNAAFALDGLAVNVARAIGPAIAGIFIAYLGPAAAFGFNTFAFTVLALTLLAWNGNKDTDGDGEDDVESNALTTQSFLTSFRTGLQFVRYSPQIRRILLRSFLFLFPASVMWAMLPIVGRQVMGLESIAYGSVVACAGLGAMLGITFSTIIQQRMGQEYMMALAAILFGIHLVSMAFVQDLFVLCVSMMMAGFGWIIILAIIQASVVPVTPKWVISRVIALYSLVFFGSITVGSMVWGLVAEQYGVTLALSAAISVLIVSSLAALRLPMPATDTEEASEWVNPSLDFYSPFFPELEINAEGPVMVSFDYRVPDQNAEAFSDAMVEVAAIRKKNGAYQWTVLQDVEKPNIQKEQFIVSSRQEYQEQTRRMTEDDGRIIADLVELTEEKTLPSQRFFRLEAML